MLAKRILQKELETFEVYFKEAVQSKVSLLDTIMRYIVKNKGKQMRPLFVLLSAKLVDQPNDKTYRAAALVELLHNATLVHDDIVDNANKRRGFFSINALWKNKIAVLVGDYLLSKGLLLALENKDFQTLTLLSTAVKEMSEGELLQMEKSRKLDISEEQYFTIIHGKTASLLSVACAVGIASVTENEEKIETLKKIGTHIGLAFQIRDDLFDYSQFDTGKSKGNDLIEKKITLPLIFAFSKMDLNLKNKIKKMISKGLKKSEDLKLIIDSVKNFGGVEYATKIMEQHKNMALELINTFDNTAAIDAYKDLIEFVIKRKK